METIFGGAGLFGFITKPFKTFMTAGHLKDKAVQTLDNINMFLVFCELILLFFLFYTIFAIVKNILKRIFRKKAKKMLMLFVRAKNELLILDHIKDVPKEKHVEEKLSFDETIAVLIKECDNKVYAKKIPVHDRKRMIDGLTLVKSEKTDMKTKFLLLDNGIKVFDVLLK